MSTYAKYLHMMDYPSKVNEKSSHEKLNCIQLDISKLLILKSGLSTTNV